MRADQWDKLDYPEQRALAPLNLLSGMLILGEGTFVETLGDERRDILGIGGIIESAVNELADLFIEYRGEKEPEETTTEGN